MANWAATTVTRIKKFILSQVILSNATYLYVGISGLRHFYIEILKINFTKKSCKKMKFTIIIIVELKYTLKFVKIKLMKFEFHVLPSDLPNRLSSSLPT